MSAGRRVAWPRRPNGRPRAERGSGTVWLVSVVAVLGCAGSVAVGLSAVVAAQHRAAAAADLAALSAAARVTDGGAFACAAGAAAADATGARLLDCEVVGRVATVRVEARVGRLFGHDLAVTDRARAGPGRP